MKIYTEREENLTIRLDTKKTDEEKPKNKILITRLKGNDMNLRRRLT